MGRNDSGLSHEGRGDLQRLTLYMFAYPPAPEGATMRLPAKKPILPDWMPYRGERQDYQQKGNGQR